MRFSRSGNGRRRIFQPEQWRRTLGTGWGSPELRFNTASLACMQRSHSCSSHLWPGLYLRLVPKNINPSMVGEWLQAASDVSGDSFYSPLGVLPSSIIPFFLASLHPSLLSLSFLSFLHRQKGHLNPTNVIWLLFLVKMVKLLTNKGLCMDALNCITKVLVMCVCVCGGEISPEGRGEKSLEACSIDDNTVP